MNAVLKPSLEIARALYARGQSAEALSVVDQVDASGESGPALHTLRGAILASLRRPEEAKAAILRALASDPDDYDALAWMAALCKGERDFSGAVQFAQRAVAVRPNDSAAYALLGSAQLMARDPVASVAAYRRAVELSPEVGEFWHGLGLAHQLAHSRPEAAAAFREAIRLDPRRVATYLALGGQYALFGIPGEALAVFLAGLEVDPRSAALHVAAANAFASIRNDEAAARHFAKAILLSDSAKEDYAFWLVNQGDFAASQQIFHEIAQSQPSPGRAYYGLMQTHKVSCQDLSLLEEMQAALAEPRQSEASKIQLHFAIAKANEQVARFDQAMAHFEAGNRLAHAVHNASIHLEPERLAREHAKVQACFESMSPLRIAPSQTSPILIVGMIRSGTTLLEQILSSHHRVTSTGELRFWIEEGAKLVASEPARSRERLRHLSQEYITYTELIAGKADRITDKMPLNFAYAGLIAKVMPSAKIIHIRRDPVDTCLSIYSTYFGKGAQFVYDRQNIVNYYRQYLATMDYWRSVLDPNQFIEIDYEDVIAEPRPTISKLLAYCELDWDEACLRHDENKTAINTPSRWQARQPLYRTSVARWKRYEPYLGEFSQLLTR